MTAEELKALKNKDPKPKEKEEEKPDESSGKEMEALVAQLKEANEKAAALEKSMLDTKKAHTQATQELAAIKKNAEASEKAKTFDGWMNEIREIAEEDPAAALTKAISALGYQQQANQQEMMKQMGSMRTDLELQIIKQDPDSAKFLETLDQLKEGSTLDQIQMLRGLASAAEESSRREEEQGDLKVSTRSDSRAAKKKEKTMKELDAEDASVRRTYRKLGYESLDAIDAARKSIDEINVKNHFVTGSEK